MNNHGTEPDDLIEILRFERSEQLVKAIQKNPYGKGPSGQLCRVPVHGTAEDGRVKTKPCM